MQLAEPGSATPRTALILTDNPDRCSNVITTSQYKFYGAVVQGKGCCVDVCTTLCQMTSPGFFLKAIFELLHPTRKFANFYFFVVGAMQVLPRISLTNQLPSTWMPLIFILIVDMFLMAREDLARHRSDRDTNYQPVDIVPSGGGELRRATWADVRVGDVIRVNARETFPADLLLLRGSDPPGQVRPGLPQPHTAAARIVPTRSRDDQPACWSSSTVALVSPTTPHTPYCTSVLRH